MTPLSTLRASFPISKAYVELLKSEAGLEEAELSNLIPFSLMHASFVNEQKVLADSVENCLYLLEALGSLGAASCELSLYLLAYKDSHNRTPDEVANYVGLSQRDVYAWTADRLRVCDFGMFGKGERPNILSHGGPPSAILAVTTQLLGAMRTCSSQETIDELTRRSLLSRTAPPAAQLSYRTALQDFCQKRFGKGPEYVLLEEGGPDHERQFKYNVLVPDGTQASGIGTSKKAACEAAALDLIRRHMPHLEGSGRTPPVRPRTAGRARHHDVPKAHETQIQALSAQFQVPASGRVLMSQALVHPSYVNEHRDQRVADHGFLAQFGAHLIEAIVTKKIVDRILASEIPLEGTVLEIRSGVCEEAEMVTGYSILELGQALLIGGGLPRGSLPTRLRADSLQAVLGGAYLAHGTMDAFCQSLPGQVDRWLDDRISLAVSKEGGRGPSALLQHELQALELQASYTFDQQNTAPNALYRCILLLESPILGKRFKVKAAKWGTSKARARRDLTGQMNQLVGDVCVGRIRSGPAEPMRVRSSLALLMHFLLLHTLRSIPTDPIKIARWHREGFLGASLLAARDFASFSAWLSHAKTILSVEDHHLLSGDPINEFYRIIAARFDAQSTEWDVFLNNETGRLATFIENLTPETGRERIRDSDGFRNLIQLTTIAKLHSRDAAVVRTLDLLDGYRLYRSRREPLVEIDPSSQDFLVSTRQGLLEALFDEILLLASADTHGGISQATFSSRPVDNGQASVSVRFNRPLGDVDLLRRMLMESALWQYSQVEWPRARCFVGDRLVEVRLTPLPESPDPLALTVYTQYLAALAQVRPEVEVSGRLLHDLKNELVACDAALRTEPGSRTAGLKRMYDASRHLDNAHDLIRRLLAFRIATRKPEFVEFSPSSFFQELLAEKLLQLSPTIRLVPPKSTGGVKFVTSPELLRSVLRNLITNSVEAMPHGGEILFDWVILADEDLMMIEVEDTGEGIDPETLQSILDGRPVSTHKHGGSGLGMLTSTMMVRRMGGTLMGRSASGSGTRWTILLPNQSLSLEDTSLEREPTTIANDELEETDLGGSHTLGG